MPETRPLPNDEPASVVEARSVDRLCDRFEAAWHFGPRPAIEAFLADAPASARAAALRELLALEVEYRRRDGETPKPEEYETRFGDSSHVIASVFGRAPCREERRGSAESGADTPDSSPTVELEKGTWPAPELPGYDILGRLGAGGMGVVYKARQHSLNRVVALKLIRPDVVAGLRERARFRREAEAAARLRHPHVVQVHEIGEHAGQPFAVLELVEGHTLAKEVAAGPLSMREAAVLVEKVARAVQHAHDNGILHRDLKPGNVLVAADGTPKVADFGLARWLGSPSDRTASGEVLGTPKYMAPEQAAGQLEQLSPATDVYALGTILYELLTGQPAFHGRTPLETLERVRTQEPTAPRRLRRELPRDLEAICLKCLEKSPSARYASAAALADDLKRWLSGEPTVARPLSWPLRVWRKARRHGVLSSAAALSIVAGAAGTIITLNNDPDRSIRLIEDQLARGQEVNLFPDVEGPRWFRMRAGQGTSQTARNGDGSLSISTWNLALCELVRDPRQSSFEFSLDVQIVNSEQNGHAGIYVAHEATAWGTSVLHGFMHLRFNNLRDVNDINFALPPEQRSPPLEGNPVTMERRFYADGDSYPLCDTEIASVSSPLCKPVRGKERPWHRVSIEVTPGGVRAWWDNQVVGHFSVAYLESRTVAKQKELTALFSEQIGGVHSHSTFNYRGGLGLALFRSSANFRAGVLKPISGVK
jgi:serine/threonine-protein kinase